MVLSGQEQPICFHLSHWTYRKQKTQSLLIGHPFHWKKQVGPGIVAFNNFEGLQKATPLLFIYFLEFFFAHGVSKHF